MEEDRFEDIATMLKLKHVGRLFKDSGSLLEDVAKKHGVWVSLGAGGKKFERKTVKKVMKIYLKGLKILDDKIPVFVELPKLEPKGNGGYVEKRKESSPESDKPETIVYENVDLLSSGEE